MFDRPPPRHRRSFSSPFSQRQELSQGFHHSTVKSEQLSCVSSSTTRRSTAYTHPEVSTSPKTYILQRLWPWSTRRTSAVGRLCPWMSSTSSRSYPATTSPRPRPNLFKEPTRNVDDLFAAWGGYGISYCTVLYKVKVSPSSLLGKERPGLLRVRTLLFPAHQKRVPLMFTNRHVRRKIRHPIVPIAGYNLFELPGASGGPLIVEYRAPSTTYRLGIGDISPIFEPERRLVDASFSTRVSTKPSDNTTHVSCLNITFPRNIRFPTHNKRSSQ